MPDKTERKKAQERRYRQRKEVKSKYAKYQKENFKNISASIPRAEAEYIAALFKSYGLKPSEVIRGAAFALMNGEQIPTRSEPLPNPDNGKENENPG